jgi:hypothetical protein
MPSCKTPTNVVTTDFPVGNDVTVCLNPDDVGTNPFIPGEEEPDLENEDMWVLNAWHWTITSTNPNDLTLANGWVLKRYRTTLKLRRVYDLADTFGWILNKYSTSINSHTTYDLSDSVGWVLNAGTT